MCYAVKDIANKLLVMSEACGELMTNMKLQKMMYCQQGYHLAYFGTPLFDEEIEAWMYGPVVTMVYSAYKEFGKEGLVGDKNNVIVFEDEREEALFMEVMRVYGKYSAIGLMEMTHEEEPWKSTPVGEGNIISKSTMRDFFKTKPCRTVKEISMVPVKRYEDMVENRVGKTLGKRPLPNDVYMTYFQEVEGKRRGDSAISQQRKVYREFLKENLGC